VDHVNGDKFQVLSQKDPGAAAGRTSGIDVVFESTAGHQARRAAKHVACGAKRVIITAPASGPDGTFVMGRQPRRLRPPRSTWVVSNASCTTNCLARSPKVCRQLRHREGLDETIHSYTNDTVCSTAPQGPPARAAAPALSMIPHHDGRGQGRGRGDARAQGQGGRFAMRVPTPNVVRGGPGGDRGKKTSADEVNGAFAQPPAGPLRASSAVEDAPLVSTTSGQPQLVDRRRGLHQVMDGDFVKVPSWYDNRCGHSMRCVDLVRFMATRGSRRHGQESVKDLDLKGQRYSSAWTSNVPIKNGAIKDDTRVRASLPTIQYASGRGPPSSWASHLDGQGGPQPEMSLRPRGTRLRRAAGPVGEPSRTDCVGAGRETGRRAGGRQGLVLLENLASTEEEKNDPAFARQLPNMATST